MLWLKGATSNYACAWGKIHKTVKYPTWSYSGRWASLNANIYRHFDWKSGKTETASTVVAIWTEFTEIYKILNDRNLEKDPTEFFMKAKEWISLFVSLNGKREGYETAWVTPYMHIMVTHIPKQISQNIYRARGWKEQWCSSCNNSEKVQQVVICRRCSATTAMSVGA